MSQTQSANPWNATTSLVAIALLAAWAGVAYLTGASGIVTAPPEQIFRPVGLAVVIPVALFVAAYNLAPRFRGFVLAQDLRALTMVQAWRVVGFSFLLLYAADALPALFAFPAGVGDVMIGLTAPFVVLRLTRDAAFARSWRFLAFPRNGPVRFRRGRRRGNGDLGRVCRPVAGHPDQRSHGGVAAEPVPEPDRAGLHHPALDGVLEGAGDQPSRGAPGRRRLAGRVGRVGAVETAPAFTRSRTRAGTAAPDGHCRSGSWRSDCGGGGRHRAPAWPRTLARR